MGHLSPYLALWAAFPFFYSGPMSWHASCYSSYAFGYIFLCMGDSQFSGNRLAPRSDGFYFEPNNATDDAPALWGFSRATAVNVFVLECDVSWVVNEVEND